VWCSYLGGEALAVAAPGPPQNCSRLALSPARRAGTPPRQQPHGWRAATGGGGRGGGDKTVAAADGSSSP
jgi:hypothetical protein